MSQTSGGIEYVRRGLELAGRSPRLYLAITVVYALPALLAAWLVFSIGSPEPWQNVAIFSLPWMTLVLGTVVVMMAVTAHARGRDLTLGQATWRALPHVPRYVWTNAHTSLIFWVPVGALLSLRRWQEQVLPLDESGAAGLALGWGLCIGALGLYLHTRTLLAPFLAVHGDLPATLAALESWRLSRHAFTTCLSTLLAGTLPVAVPLLVLGLALMMVLPAHVLEALEPALPDLGYAAIQLMRPILIPATYLLFRDVWESELTQRASRGAPPIPLVLRPLLALTRPLPRLAPPA